MSRHYTLCQKFQHYIIHLHIYLNDDLKLIIVSLYETIPCTKLKSQNVKTKI